MNIVGFSGISETIAFRRAMCPGLDEREYRICQGHDAAAALVADGHTVAACAEERFDRRKHSELFPAQAIQFCLEEAGISVDSVDEIAHAFDYGPHRLSYLRTPEDAKMYRELFSREAVVRTVQRWRPSFPPERIRHVPHHLAHAASAYYTSGWDECAILVIDAMGELDSVSCYRGCGGELTRLFSIPARDSLGVLYSLITLHLGFDFNADEYKIMGLAPYGDRSRFRQFFEQEVILAPDGMIRIPMLSGNPSGCDMQTYASARSYLDTRLAPRRAPESEIRQQDRDVAAALQDCLDRSLQHICAELARQTGLRRLAMAGGVALNCTANGRLLRSGLYDEIYVQPAAGDDGAALGAALFQAAQAGEVNNTRMPAPYLGPAVSAAEIDCAIRRRQPRIAVRRFPTVDETCAEAARQIADGKVIGWFRGRMEFGPRALGNRSILADARCPHMRDRVNAMVKKREGFRPFAPAVSREQAPEIFDLRHASELPYMVMIVNVKEEFRGKLPATTHVDGTARVQTVSPEDNAAFHTLLRHVGRRIGMEIVLNTSFNIKGQPIVNTADEAIDTFLGTEIDSLFLENCLISRS